jgi:uncharacterized protein YndB with AHSA1/START domain
MSDNLIAKAEVLVKANGEEVWKALTDPSIIKQYMFGTEVVSDWKPGSNIVWKGEFNGKPYEDTGKIMELVPCKKLVYTHSSGGDTKNVHTITVNLLPDGNTTKVILQQDHNLDEKAKQESEKNWKTMLDGLKEIVEK